MYIKNVFIKNYRNFKEINVPLYPYTTIIGDNDVGKTNFFDAIKLLLNNNSIQFYSKRLALTDINSSAVSEFRTQILGDLARLKENIDNETILSSVYTYIPNVTIKLTFADAKDEYQKKLLCDWLNQDENGDIVYEIEYIFKPKNDFEFIKTMVLMLEVDEKATIPIDMYEYSIYSTNNNKSINPQKYCNFNVSIINAERDNFSENTNKMSYRLISSLLEKNLETEEKSKISKAYNNFFDEIKELSSYKEVFKKLEDDKFENLSEIIKRIELIPNFPNLNTIFSNINIGYGDEFLFQKGLGKRNLILLLLLFSNYNAEGRKFNLMCIEEPEAHLSNNNLNIVLSFIEKSISQNDGFSQTIITSHNSKTINKLKFNNVVVLKENQAITFEKDDYLSNYLAKRPNFDVLKILFSNKVILVEGVTEEMLINTWIQLNENIINEIEVISIGQKGFRTFLNIWKKLNDNSDKKIGVVRDFDNNTKTKGEHDAYNNDTTIFVRTTDGYTLEDDLVDAGDNKNILSKFFNTTNPVKHMKEAKAESMFKLCESMLLPNDDENKITITMPKHIEEILDGLQKK